MDEQNSKQIHLKMAMDTTVQLKKDLQVANEIKLTLKDGITFKLTGFQDKRKDKQPFAFPPFYTHPRGYHMAFVVYANGNGSAKGTHISVFVQLQKGNYDDELKWPFVGEVTFTLLNQLKDENHYSRIESFHLTS